MNEVGSQQAHPGDVVHQHPRQVAVQIRVKELEVLERAGLLVQQGFEHQVAKAHPHH